MAYGVLQDGSLAILADDQEIAAMSFSPHFHPDLGRRVEAARARVWVFDGKVLSLLFELSLETPYPKIARFPDGRWLIVAARTQGQANNARLFNPNGELLGRIMLGDAIADIHIDDGGAIWVGWFDEGIAQDWVIPGREWPPSTNGLACFNDKGEVIWEPEPFTHVECDGLNVDGGKAWMLAGGLEMSVRCFSRTARPIEWPVELPPVSALAVHGEYLLAAGGFDADLDVVLVRLAETMGNVIGRWVLDTQPLSRSAAALLVGRGRRLHAIAGGEWREWDVEDVRRRRD